MKLEAIMIAPSSPILIKLDSFVTIKGSNPESFKGGKLFILQSKF